MQMVCHTASKALAGPLLPSQQLLMLAHMDTDPHLVHSMLFLPQQLGRLVDQNPMLAFHVLMRIRGSRRVPEFHQVGRSYLMQLPVRFARHLHGARWQHGHHEQGCMLYIEHPHKMSSGHCYVMRTAVSLLHHPSKHHGHPQMAMRCCVCLPVLLFCLAGAWSDAAQPAQHGGHQQADSIRVPAPGCAADVHQQLHQLMR